MVYTDFPYSRCANVEVLGIFEETIFQGYNFLYISPILTNGTYFTPK